MNESINKIDFKLWGRKSVFYTPFAFFISFIGFGSIFLFPVEFLHNLIIFFFSIIFGILARIRNRIILELSKKLTLFRFYQLQKFLKNVTIFGFLIWVGWGFIGSYIGSYVYQNYNTILFNFWTQLLGIIFLLSLLMLYFESLSNEGIIKVFFDQSIINLNNFRKCKPWLEKSLKKVEEYSRIMGISISYRDLYYKLNIKMIKNEDISEYLRNLENALIRNDPSLYDSLLLILNNETKISQIKKFSLKNWFSQIPPDRLLTIFMTFLLGVIALIYFKKIPF